MGDVLVIGGGLSGALAALALREGGARVVLSRAGWGATASYSGAFELATSGAAAAFGAAVPHAPGAPAAPAAGWSLMRHLEDMAAHQPLHPFAILGAQAAMGHLEAGYAALGRALQPVGMALPALDRDAPQVLMPHSAGCLTSVAATSSLEGEAVPSPFGSANPGRWGVLHLPDWGAPLSSRTIAGWCHDAVAWGIDVPELVPLQGPNAAPFCTSALATARYFDDIQHVHALAEVLRPQTAGLTGVILPPVLGLGAHRSALQTLQRVLNLPVVEALAGLPSAPGARLMLALEAALVHHGIRVVSPVTDVQVRQQTFESAHTQTHGTVHAGACVLATGRFRTSGLQWKQGTVCTEPLFKLPVLTAFGPLTERNALEVTRRRLYEDHPVMTAGVGVDEQLRPLGPAGIPLANVYAAGLVVGGYSPTASRCADGVALATAHRAATHILGGPTTVKILP